MRAVEVVTCPQGDAELTRELVRRGHQFNGSREEVHRGGRVRSLPGTNSGTPQSLSSFECEFSRVFVASRKLAHVLERLLEVVTDELVRAVPSVKPSRRMFVQFRALRLWDAAIRHVAHEHVMEAEQILLHGMDEASLGQAERPDVARAFGILTVPATVVMDRSGAVVGANQGFATADRLAAQLGLG